MRTFQSKTASVTAGASGVGRALCKELACRRATVVIAGTELQRPQRVEFSIAGQGGRAEAAEVDVADAKPIGCIA